MNIGAQSGLLAAIVAVAVAISVLLRSRGLVSALFTAFAANLFLHYMGAFLYNLAGYDFWLQVDRIAAALLPVTSLLFYGYFLWRDPEPARRYLQAAYLCTALLVVFLLSPWSPSAEPSESMRTYAMITTAVVLIYVFLGLYLCAHLIYLRYKELESQRERKRLRYLLVFHLVAVSFVLLGMLPGPLGFLRTWGDLVSVFFLYFVSQSLLKYRLLDLQELLGRTLVLTAVALILATVFGVLVFWAGGSPEISLFHTFVASIVILILFEPLRDKLEGSASRMLFRERFELRRKMEDLRREIANIISLERMARVLLDTPYDRMRISHVSFYLLEPGGASYRLQDHRGQKPIERIDVAAHRALFEQLRKSPTVVLAENFERQLADHGAPADLEPAGDAKRARQVLDTLHAMLAGICIPLVGSDEILGLWNLHDENTLESYSTEEIALLMAIGEQAAINIENSRMFEKIRERDRLAVLGEMAAGLAHEIRNPLGAIKGAAQYLDPAAKGANGMSNEEAAEFLQIIIEEVDRLNRVVNQFLDYARPFQDTLVPTDVNRVIKQTVRLLAPGLEGKGIQIEMSLDSELPPAQANDEQLTQVFLNLLHNAAEAMPEGGRIIVCTRHIQPMPAPWGRPGRHATVQVEISDQGPGIAPEAQERIFLPFFTTKERGTGLGLAISERIVQHQGGEIRVRSRPGEGTSFLVDLPATVSADEKPIGELSAEPATEDREDAGPAHDLSFPVSRDTD